MPSKRTNRLLVVRTVMDSRWRLVTFSWISKGCPEVCRRPIIFSHFRRGLRVGGENFRICPPDDLRRRPADDFAELAVGHPVAEIIIDLLDENITGQVVHDRFQQLQAVPAGQFAFAAVGDILNNAENFRLPADFTANFFHPDLEMARRQLPAGRIK